MREELLKKFEEVYGSSEGASVYFAPGRVNLIGDHTDYNGGHVFPCALSIGTYAAARKRTDSKLTFYSINFENAGINESQVITIYSGVTSPKNCNGVALAIDFNPPLV